MRRLLRVNGFRSLLAGQALATGGHQVAALALPTLAIVGLHATAFEVAVLGALGSVPSTLFGIFAGVVVDRLPRRTLMIGADLGRALLILFVGLATLRGSVDMFELYAAAAGFGVLGLIFDVAYQSHVPDLVEGGELATANATLEVNRSAATVMGPGVSGGLIQLAGIARSLFVACAALVISLVVLSRGRHAAMPPAPTAPSQRRAPIADDIREGLRLVLRDRRLVSISLCTATSNLGAFAFWSVSLVFAYRTLHMTPGQYGLVAAIGNVGLVAGAIAAAPAARRFGVGPTLFAAAALLGASMLVTPLAAVGLAGVVLAGSQLVTNFQLPRYGVNQVALRQAVTPRTLQGRMNSIMRTIAVSTIPVGSLAGGAIASISTPAVAMVTGGLVACLAPLWLVGLLSVRHLPAAQDAALQPAPA